MNRRPLAEMLSDVYDAVQITCTTVSSLRATRVELNLPVEVTLENRHDETMFLADLPVWRWRTEFDLVPGRLTIRWEEVVL